MSDNEIQIDGGITKYNKHEIKKLRGKLLHISHYIRFLEKKIARTN